MISRRQLFTSGASAASVATLGVGLGLTAPTPARAQVLEAAIAVVEICLALYQMFGPKGPSIVDLINIQTQLLEKISKQIEVIQKSLNDIFTSLDQLKTLVRALPDDTVKALYKNNIAGAVRHYEEVLKTYGDDLKANGIAAAQCANLNELESEVLQQLRQARDVLFNYTDELTIPTVCSALQTESNCMIMANYRSTRQIEALSAYRSWLAPFLDPASPQCLQTVLDATGVDLTKLSQLSQGDPNRVGYVCIEDEVLGQDGEKGADMRPTSWTLESYQYVQIPDQSYAQLMDMVKQLGDSGEPLLPAVTDFQQSIYGYQTVRQVTFGGAKTVARRNALSKAATAMGFPVTCPAGLTPDDEADRYHKMAQLMLRWVTYGALHLLATNGVAFIDKMTTQLAALPAAPPAPACPGQHVAN